MLRVGGWLIAEDINLAGFRFGQDLEDVFGKSFVNFLVTRNRLRRVIDRIVIPIVLATMTNEVTTLRFEFTHKVPSFHPTSSLANFRIPGISPLDRSL